MKKSFTTLIVCCTALTGIYAQTGAISGKVTDNNKQPIANAIVVVSKNNVPIRGTTTDKDGNYTVKSIPAGSYDVKARNLDYNARMVPYVPVTADKTTPLDFTLSPKTAKAPVVGH